MNQPKEIIGEICELPTANIPATTPADLLNLAVSKNADMATLERLMDLQDRYDAKQAKNAYTDSMAEFKRSPPEIVKRKKVEFTTRSGDTTSYRHAEIGDVCDAVTGTMAAHGFSHRWDTRQIEGRIEVTCIITHRLGHSESTMMFGPPDNSGSKNAIQQIASTVTYLQRYTLLSAVGLATNSMDDDGQSAGGFDQHGNPVGAADDTQPDGDAASVARRKAVHDEAFGRNSESVSFIKERIKAGDIKAAISEWRLLSQADQMALWLATKKGGCFSTDERQTIKENNSGTEPQGK